MPAPASTAAATRVRKIEFMVWLLVVAAPAMARWPLQAAACVVGAIVAPRARAVLELLQLRAGEIVRRAGAHETNLDQGVRASPPATCNP
jgi:hypothetical protein